MKWLRIILPIFLIMGMLLCINSVAYADPGDGDSGLDVDITVTGDNADVGVDLYGDDNTANVNFHSLNPSVYINGQNLNEPTAVYNTSRTGASAIGVRRIVKYVMFPYMDDIWNRLNLTAEGLAKVILMAQGHESELDTQTSLVDTHDNRLTNLESETASLGEQMEARDAALEAQDAATQAYIVAVQDYLRADYNRKLTTIIGAFSLVVIGLGAGLFLLWRRIRI